MTEFLIKCALVWIALSFLGSIALCWLLKTKRIGFAPIEDRNEFSRNWEPRK